MKQERPADRATPQGAYPNTTSAPPGALRYFYFYILIISLIPRTTLGATHAERRFECERIFQQKNIVFAESIVQKRIILKVLLVFKKTISFFQLQ
jgi:hypothetical protein